MDEAVDISQGFINTCSQKRGTLGSHRRVNDEQADF